jgi:hypothetical protein
MRKTRCKFQVSNIEGQNVRLNAVVGDNDPESENSSFWQATPSGELTLNILNQDALDMFHIGDNFYLDLIPVEKSRSSTIGG